MPSPNIPSEPIPPLPLPQQQQININAAIQIQLEPIPPKLESPQPHDDIPIISPPFSITPNHIIIVRQRMSCQTPQKRLLQVL